ncbi:MAG: MBL fold metallo-hydrolase [Candidatus Saccharibacteria bacterium]
MKLTKYEHACLTVEKDEQILVVDPGAFTTDFIAPENVVAIVITHEHADHFDHDMIAAIINKNPEAIIVAHQDITSKIEASQTKSVSAGDKLTIGVFDLEFFGGKHAVIHPSMPLVANLGVMVNELLYYPGDSFTVPGKSVDTLALPVGAPWLKLSETIDFLTAVKPRLAFPTHDAVLSPIGKSLPDRILPGFAANFGGEYQRLENPIEL